MESITNEIYQRKLFALAGHLDFCRDIGRVSNVSELESPIEKAIKIVDDLQNYEVKDIKSKVNQECSVCRHCVIDELVYCRIGMCGNYFGDPWIFCLVCHKEHIDNAHILSESIKQ